MTLEVFRIALAALRANVLRSILTMLGIVIGVAAVIAMIALGDGAQKSVRDRIGRLGTTVLQIDTQRLMQGGVGTNVTKKMTMDDVKSIEERSPHVLAVQPQQDKNFQIVWRNKNINMTVYGVSSNYLEVRKYEIDQGRMFTSGEDLGKQRVVVLGAGAVSQLDIADPSSILGDVVRINGMQFQVIGTTKAKGSTGFGSPDDQVLIPFGTSRWRLFKTDRVDDIFALASSEDEIPIAMGEISLALRRSHHIMPGGQDDFRIRNQADILSTLSETTAVFGSLLAGIAAVSLLVGGIGIMNIMLVSVTERTREIGIRKALGATRKTILLQFLIEAITLCLLGGAVGVAAGVGGAIVLRDAMGWSTVIGPTSIALAFAFATVTGLVFGVWPARRASALDPIVALRYE